MGDHGNKRGAVEQGIRKEIEVAFHCFRNENIDFHSQNDAAAAVSVAVAAITTLISIWISRYARLSRKINLITNSKTTFSASKLRNQTMRNQKPIESM